MLLRFAVRNFRSIGDQQELLLTATTLKDREDGLISVPDSEIEVLPSVVIYGANASGKSNLLRALNFFRSGILRSHSRTSGGPIGRQAFLLGDNDDADTSSFECDFVLRKLDVGKRSYSNARMTYGYKVSDSEILEEWLYAYPKQHRQVWFHRKSTEEPPYYFGSEFRGQNRVIAGNTRPDALFLSTANANNHPQTKQVFEFFREMFFRLDRLDDDGDDGSAVFLENSEMREKIIGFLKAADVGICSADVKTIKRPESLTSLVSEVRAIITKHFPDNDNIATVNAPEEKKRIRLGHAGKGEVVYFPLEDESRGTLAFLNLIGWVLVALGAGSVFVVDELDASLHPHLSRKIIELFNERKTNPNGAQLVFTTHDTALLSSDLMRRDQVWFTEKSGSGATHIYPLSDLKLRKGDDIAKGYLQGRFGAIPFVGNFADLVGDGR